MNYKENFKKKVRISIKYKILLLILGVVLINILINTLFINLFMDKYYIYKSQKKLITYFEELKSVYTSNKDNLSDKIVRLERSGVSVRIIDSNFRYLYRSFTYGSSNVSVNTQMLDKDLIKKLGDKEFILINAKDENNENYVIYYLSRINNDIAVLSYPIKVINDNTNIAATFTTISSVITFAFISLFIYYISYKATNKIKDIEKITEDISNLNFNNKIETNSKDELGNLLENINKMSEKLQDSIEKLRKSNLELKNEKDDLQKLDEMRKQLITNISHEFKTPLAIISGYAQLLKSKKLDKHAYEYISYINIETEKLNSLIIEFLELSKIESNTQKILMEKINLSKIIDEYIDSMKLEIEKKELILTKKYNKDIFIYSDLNSVNKIVSNIISNAIKYVDDKKIINIVIEEEMKNDDIKVCFRVYNSTNTITKKDLKTIWKNMYSKKVERNKNGTGLGLLIVKSICKNINITCNATLEDDLICFEILFESNTYYNKEKNKE